MKRQLKTISPRSFLAGVATKMSNGGPVRSLLSQMLERESVIGAQLFGAIPPNRERQFFMLDSHTWIWYEAWKDSKGRHEVTTRYEIRGSRIYKIQNNQPGTLLLGSELSNFYNAVNQYYYRVAAEVYGRPVQA